MPVTHRKKNVEVEAHRLDGAPGTVELLAFWVPYESIETI